MPVRLFNERPLQLPPRLTTAPAAVQKAGDEYTRLLADSSTAWDALTAAEAARASAEVADRQAFGKALRAGKPDPGTKAIDAADRAIASARRHVEALQVAVAESRAALVDTIEAYREEWSATIDAATEDGREAFRAAIAALDAAHAQLGEALSLGAWLRNFPDRPTWGVTAASSQVRAMTAANGDPQTWDAIVGALLEHVDPPDTTNAAAVAQVMVPLR